MLRFVLLAVPLLLLVLGLAASIQDLAGFDGDTSMLAELGLERQGQVSGPLRLAEWLLEAIGLTALFLMVSGRGGAWWLDGLLTGGLAWIFRGPGFLLTLARVSRLPGEPWVTMAQGWLVSYLACGLVLALLARQLRRPAP